MVGRASIHVVIHPSIHPASHPTMEGSWDPEINKHSDRHSVSSHSIEKVTLSAPSVVWLSEGLWRRHDCPQRELLSFGTAFSDDISMDGHQGRVSYPAEDASTFSLLLRPMEYQVVQCNGPSSTASQSKQYSYVFTGFMQCRNLSGLLSTPL